MARYTWTSHKECQCVVNVLSPFPVAVADATGACIYLSVVVVQTWNASVHRTWQHYARKERERAELMDFIRQVGSGDHGSTMDQPWIKDGSKWWTKNFKHVDVLCWYRIRTNIMIVIINYDSEYAYVFSRQVICPWLLHLHDWLDTLCCISFTVGSISYPIIIPISLVDQHYMT